MTRADVEQEAIVTLLAALRDGTTDPVALTRHIGRRMCQLKTHQRRRRMPPIPSDAEAESDDGHDGLTVLEILDNIAEGLTPRQREVLETTFAEGLSDAEGAEKLGITVETYRLHKHQAIARLRDAQGM